MRRVLHVLLTLLAIFVLPVAMTAAAYWIDLRNGDAVAADWRTADRSSAGLLPPAEDYDPAVVRVFSARTVGWRGVVGSHAWIVVKEEGADAYRRWDYTAWGSPVRVDGYVADGRWFGRVPEVVFALDGPEAAALVPRIEAAVADYPHRAHGDYRVWPGPNSNTFVAAVMDAVPEIRASLPPTAVGKDYPYDGRWLRATSTRTGFKVTLGGYAGLTIGWIEGIEVNLLGMVAGIDIRRPGIKLPGVGRIGI